MPHRSIEQIKANVRLEEIVCQRGVILRAASQGGERLEGPCPFHAFDETPSFQRVYDYSAVSLFWLRGQRRCETPYRVLCPGVPAIPKR